jgi:hypothetical protein
MLPMEVGGWGWDEGHECPPKTLGTAPILQSVVIQLPLSGLLDKSTECV